MMAVYLPYVSDIEKEIFKQLYSLNGIRFTLIIHPYFNSFAFLDFIALEAFLQIKWWTLVSS